MCWTEDDNTTRRPKRAVGRPVENPFSSTQSEEEFVRRGQAMLRCYYHPSPQNEKKHFVFTPTRSISKTLFWSIIYVHLVTTEAMHSNLQGYRHAVCQHFGPEVCSDRTSLCQSVGSLLNLSAHLKHSFVKEGRAGNQQAKYRAIYQYVVERWEAAADAPPQS